ncbi:MAG: NTP transferase domain-containing protein [Pelagibacterales bacterium]|nr:NTP transferase domain-containing protein [Pelagibacterales bacterium]
MNLNISKIKDSLSVIILCGGEGQRLMPLTQKVPKPLIKIRNKAIIEYIISHFKKFKVSKIIIASGYKDKLIKNFFKKKNRKIKIINTGLNTSIIGRIKKIENHLEENIILCYGDTLVDINLNKLINLYAKDRTKFLVSSYELKSSFGILSTNKKNFVTKFKEKPKLGVWFNVGYFLFSKSYFKDLKKFNKFENFLTYLVKKKNLKTFKHKGKHITINTISELEDAKTEIIKFI